MQHATKFKARTAQCISIGLVQSVQ